VVTCEDVHTLAGDAIDRELAPVFIEGFYHHLERCPPCRRSFELERITKNIVQTMVPRLRTPSNVQREITETIENELQWWDQPYGGVLTQRDAIPIVHVIYKIGNDLLYVFEIQECDLRGDKDPVVSAETRNECGGAAVIDSQSTSIPIIIWKQKNIVCLAGSTMRVEETVFVAVRFLT
jgi:hypothetical protein